MFAQTVRPQKPRAIPVGQGSYKVIYSQEIVGEKINTPHPPPTDCADPGGKPADLVRFLVLNK